MVCGVTFSATRGGGTTMQPLEAYAHKAQTMTINSNSVDERIRAISLTPETKGEVLVYALCNYTKPSEAPGVWQYPQASGGHLGIYIPLWVAHFREQCSCRAVPLLCGQEVVQGASPYKTHACAVAIRHFDACLPMLPKSNPNAYYHIYLNRGLKAAVDCSANDYQ